ncbi:DUF2730 family protein [uncultured Sphingomonas sp.]|uniref:DUF2730 family protein n=1 Tax=uncultured Sphingomonas sp. TaxID=158754 RepID=UPI002583626C|nr:DUF2730 family protein [uncultured Sphingomonas sp.]
MTISELGQLAGIGGALLGVANIFWTWINHGHLPTKTALEKLAGDVDRQDTRITKLEADICHLPTKDDLNRLELKVVEMLGQMKAVEVEMQATGRTLRRVEDHLRGERV